MLTPEEESTLQVLEICSETQDPVEQNRRIRGDLVWICSDIKRQGFVRRRWEGYLSWGELTDAGRAKLHELREKKGRGE